MLLVIFKMFLLLILYPLFFYYFCKLMTLLLMLDCNSFRFLLHTSNVFYPMVRHNIYSYFISQLLFFLSLYLFCIIISKIPPIPFITAFIQIDYKDIELFTCRILIHFKSWTLVKSTLHSLNILFISRVPPNFKITK